MKFDKENTIRVIKYKYGSVANFTKELNISRTLLYRFLNSNRVSLENETVNKILVALSKEEKVKIFEEN